MHSLLWGPTMNFLVALIWIYLKPSTGIGLRVIKVGGMRMHTQGRSILSVKVYVKMVLKVLSVSRWLQLHGNEDAAYKIGLTFLNGINATPNAKEAFHWFKFSADRGSIASITRLAKMYEDGNGIEADPVKANQLYLKAAKSGDQWAQFCIGLRYQRGNHLDENLAQSFKWFSIFVLRGCPRAQVALGGFCDQGYACPKDGNKAMEWFRRAADQGDVMGMDKLGYAYLFGRNVEVDYAEAATWLIKAADLGSADAIFYIGEMLRRGLGVTRNLGKAAQWMLGAAEKGYAPALRLFVSSFFIHF